tara:strand:- start:373 stop:690 length:318 start_codon:yes stop_codon:yes gene_type:complete
MLNAMDSLLRITKSPTLNAMTSKLNREELTELKEFLTERMVDNMSTKDLEEYVADDLFNYFDKLGEHEFLEEAKNYWDDSFDEVVEDIKSYTKSDFKAQNRPCDS